MQPRISAATGAFMLIMALLFDFLQFIVGFIPVIGQVIGTVLGAAAGGTFWFWFKIKGVELWNKKGATLGLGALVEVIPVLGMLPAWTLAVSRTITLSRISDAADRAGQGEASAV
jgi:hypothetical protein